MTTKKNSTSSNIKDYEIKEMTKTLTSYISSINDKFFADNKIDKNAIKSITDKADKLSTTDINFLNFMFSKASRFSNNYPINKQDYQTSLTFSNKSHTCFDIIKICNTFFSNPRIVNFLKNQRLIIPKVSLNKMESIQKQDKQDIEQRFLTSQEISSLYNSKQR